VPQVSILRPGKATPSRSKHPFLHRPAKEIA
jgi:hypothetical protein